MAFMYAMLEPWETLVKYEEKGRTFERLSLLELMKTKPFGAIWDYYCMKNNVPVGEDYIAEIVKHEKEVLSKR
jgi:L-rhamnose isomerase